MGFSGGSVVKNPPSNAGNAGSIPGSGKITLEKEMTTHSSILAWRIPWTEESGGLQPKGSQRVGHNGAAEHACLPMHFRYILYPRRILQISFIKS